MYCTYWLGMRLMAFYPKLPGQPYKICLINVCSSPGEGMEYYSLLGGPTTDGILFDNLDKY